MSDEDIKNEVGKDNINEEATEPPPETKIEASEEPTVKETKVKAKEIKTEEVKEEEQQFKNKTDRMKHKKVNCKDCGAQSYIEDAKIQS